MIIVIIIIIIIIIIIKIFTIVTFFISYFGRTKLMTKTTVMVVSLPKANV